MKQKTYYNQDYVANEIHKLTGYSKQEVCSVLDALSFTVIDHASDITDETGELEIKISTGIKISAKKQSARNTDANLCPSGFMNTSKDRIMIKAKLTDDYKKKINTLHREKTMGSALCEPLQETNTEQAVILWKK